MGFFINGYQLEAYKEAYCNKCIHNDDCGIWKLHMQWTFTVDPEKRDALNLLIPMYDSTVNMQCNFFGLRLFG